MRGLLDRIKITSAPQSPLKRYTIAWIRRILCTDLRIDLRVGLRVGLRVDLRVDLRPEPYRESWGYS